jgi:hypothetical protein
MKSQDNERMNALGKALPLVLDGAEMNQTRKNSVITGFLEAFDDQEKLVGWCRGQGYKGKVQAIQV